jgi:hypothetical protein
MRELDARAFVFAENILLSQLPKRSTREAAE